MKDNLEEMLRHALTPKDEPDIWLNQNVINQARRNMAMKKSGIKRVPAAVLTAAIILTAGGVTGYAAWRYLKPENTAEILSDKKLADAFRGKDAVNINESQSCGGYKVTLLGMVSGEKLSQYEVTSDGEVLSDRTYAVAAIEKADGSPMPDTSEEEYGEVSFFVSPFIKGENPAIVNAYIMNGGYSECVEDGIQYRIIDCDNLESFAEKGVYLGVMDGTFYNNEAYCYDEELGEITRNEEYNGVNALFSLPFDKSKADEKAAEEQLKQWEQEMSGEEDEMESDSSEATEEEWDARRVQEEAKLIPETVKTLNVDEKGYIHYEWEYQGMLGSGMLSAEELFEDESDTGMSDVMSITVDQSGKYIFETYTKNVDGTITAALYRQK